ncbi:LysR family transcriptional regulator [Nitratireductor sp. XY-223]|uniref:LysR family transcriptional regulator n=1 Tax=Nitratireductor sp. XY-223 TaxID=2561926 RepID=UPI0010A9C7A1|nr:LysR family transcriptional regulator [Nitratireductor sp. XY-223]
MHDLNAVAVFVQVAQSGSFSAAARNLSMPLSTVSRKVSDLENSLGAKLLERSTRSLRLTYLGAVYLEHCRRGLEEFEAADLALLDKQDEVTGLLRISLPPNLADTVFVPIIDRFQRRYPQATVAVLVAERIVDLVEDGIDLSFRVGLLRDSSLVARKLVRYRHVMVANPDYLAECGAPKSLADLASHRFVTFGFTPGAGQRWTLHKGDRTETVEIRPTLCVNDYAAVEKAALVGRGIAELPSILCSASLATGALVQVLPEWRFQEISLQAVHSGRRNMSRLSRLFLDTCIDELRSIA